MADVITLTLNPAIDKSSSVDRLVANEKLRCNQPTYEPGGGGLNVSRVLSELGSASLALYTSGGHTGELLCALLQKEDKIEQLTTKIEGWTRENLLVIESSTHSQYRFGMPGPELKESEWQTIIAKLEKRLGDARYLIASGSLPQGVPDDFYKILAEKAKARAVRLILDTSGLALREGLKGNAYLIKPNLRELRQLTGQELEDETDQEAAAENIIREGWCEVVVLSLGSAGALLVTKNEKKRLRSPTVKVVSKVGAGDSMIGGIVFGLLQNMAIGDAVRYGIACGAATVSSPGTQLCKKEHVEQLYRKTTGD